MKRTLCLFALIGMTLLTAHSGRAMSHGSLAALPQQSMTVKQLQEHYQKFFDIEIDEGTGGKSFSVDTAKLPAEDPFAGFVNDNRFFLSYLLLNGTQIRRSDIPITDKQTVKSTYINKLKADKQFNQLLLPVLVHYLKTRNIEVEDFKVGVRKELPLKNVMSVAARLFYPDSIRPDGGIASHICSGINGFKDFEGERDLLVEAFTYSVVVQELYDAKYGILKEYNKIMGPLKGMNLSSDLPTKLVRLQGIAWAGMSQSEALRKALLDEYDKKKAYLPFVIALG